jgi:cyclophilin family peptidyl-prolyl cis-trans isomerase
MRHKYLIYWIVLLGILIGVSACSRNQADIVIKTQYGEIFVKLYDETPKHKANFLALTDTGYFKGLTFFRVIADAVAQGGGKGFYPDGDPRNLVDAEINPRFIHKKGAFCAPRYPDEMNPERKSSGSQFYITLGKTFTSEELDTILKEKNIMLRNKAVYQYKRLHSQELLEQYQQSPEGKWLQAYDLPKLKVSNPKEYLSVSTRINDGVDSLIIRRKLVSFQPFSYSAEQRKIYQEIGGLPDLDGDYTVMGEVIKGIEVAEKISRSVTEVNSNVPAEKIPFKIERVK